MFIILDLYKPEIVSREIPISERLDISDILTGIFSGIKLDVNRGIELGCGLNSDINIHRKVSCFK